MHKPSQILKRKQVWEIDFELDTKEGRDLTGVGEAAAAVLHGKPFHVTSLPDVAIHWWVFPFPWLYRLDVWLTGIHSPAKLYSCFLSPRG